MCVYSEAAEKSIFSNEEEFRQGMHNLKNRLFEIEEHMEKQEKSIKQGDQLVQQMKDSWEDELGTSELGLENLRKKLDSFDRMKNEFNLMFEAMAKQVEYLEEELGSLKKQTPDQLLLLDYSVILYCYFFIFFC